MATTASIIIEVDEKGATQAFQRINAEGKALGAGLSETGRISQQTFNNIEGGALRARESSALLQEELGVKIPRAMRGIIAETSGYLVGRSSSYS